MSWGSDEFQRSHPWKRTPASQKTRKGTVPSGWAGKPGGGGHSISKKKRALHLEKKGKENEKRKGIWQSGLRSPKKMDQPSWYVILTQKKDLVERGGVGSTIGEENPSNGKRMEVKQQENRDRGIIENRHFNCEAIS